MHEWLVVGLDILAFFAVCACLYYCLKIYSKLPGLGMLLVSAGFIIILFLRILLIARDFGSTHMAGSGEFAAAYVLLALGFRGIYGAIRKMMG